MNSKINQEFELAMNFVLSATESYMTVSDSKAEKIDNNEYASVVEAVEKLVSLSAKTENKVVLEIVNAAKEFLSSIELVDSKAKIYSIDPKKAEVYNSLMKKLIVSYSA